MLQHNFRPDSKERGPTLETGQKVQGGGGGGGAGAWGKVKVQEHMTHHRSWA